MLNGKVPPTTMLHSPTSLPYMGAASEVCYSLLLLYLCLYLYVPMYVFMYVDVCVQDA